VRILGLDTATAATTVALLDTDRAPDPPIERRDDPATGTRPRHSARLLEFVVDVLAQAGCGWTEVDRIAVGVGPGTFTGLRIGVSTALGLARARDIPIVGVSTLRSLASAAVGEARQHGAESVVAVIDARRGEVFAAAWQLDEVAGQIRLGERWLAPAALAPDALAQILAPRGRAALAVGDGAIAFRQALAPSGCRIPEDDSGRHRVSAIEHCRMAFGMAPEAPQAIRPDYLRLPDAELSLRAAQQR
jgi:tRNA threonylcarbamoyladenosine biosynthesis protein TsaB